MEFIIENHEYVSVWKNTQTNQFLLKSNQKFQNGKCLTPFSSRKILEIPTYLSVQRNDKEHFLLKPIFLQYINHSCDPNVFFDLEKNELIALKVIEEDEELNFFYPSTEWEMTQPFNCNCKSNNCLNSIKGAKFIHHEILEKYQLSPFIKNKTKELILAL